MTARSAVLIRLWKGHLVEMDDALNECPHRDGKCPIYPTFIASVRTSA